MKRARRFFAATTLILWFSSTALAVPTQYGDTGLLSQPTAETLNAGNICIGLWANHAAADPSDATIVPASITLGLGAFLEAYGSYPNLLFNDDELESGRGFADVGFKLRILGKRSSPFKLALDGQARRSISDNPEFDGLTDYMGRVIASFKPGRFGIHANAGYLSTEAPKGVDYDDQYVFGGGIEIYPSTRLRLIAEMEALTEKQEDLDRPQEASVGVQYFLSPHLTINLGVGMGLSDASPDWRILFGFSSCQGVGTYQRPIPKIVEPLAEQVEEKKAPVKVVKIRTLTPLIPKTAPVETSPVSDLEVPVEPGKEEVVLRPSERLNIPGTEVLSALPISPVGSAPAVEVATTTPATTAMAVEPQGLTAATTGTGGKISRLKPISPRVPAQKAAAPEAAPVAAPQEFAEKAAPAVTAVSPVAPVAPAAEAVPAKAAPVAAPQEFAEKAAPAVTAVSPVAPVAPAAEAVPAKIASALVPQEMMKKSTSVANAETKTSTVAQKVAETSKVPAIDFGQPVTAVVYRKFRLPEFTFEYDQSNLSEEGKKSISRIVDQLRKEGRWFVVRVDGHTDSIGSADYN